MLGAFAPVAASTQAVTTDRTFVMLLVLSGVIVLIVFTLVVTFAIRFRRGSTAPRGELPAIVGREFEVGWTTATLFVFLFLFWWAGSAQLSALVPPKDAIEIHVVAKQWMWKTQHPQGAREINELHVPADTPVRLVMTSQDVIHSSSCRSSASRRTSCPVVIPRRGSRPRGRAYSTCSAPSIAARIMRGCWDGSSSCRRTPIRAGSRRRARRTGWTGRARRCSSRGAARVATPPRREDHAPSLDGIYGRTGPARGRAAHGGGRGLYPGLHSATRARYRGRLRSHNAKLRRGSVRRRDPGADRLYPVARNACGTGLGEPAATGGSLVPVRRPSAARP